MSDIIIGSAASEHVQPRHFITIQQSAVKLKPLKVQDKLHRKPNLSGMLKCQQDFHTTLGWLPKATAASSSAFVCCFLLMVRSSINKTDDRNKSRIISPIPPASLLSTSPNICCSVNAPRGTAERRERMSANAPRRGESEGHERTAYLAVLSAGLQCPLKLKLLLLTLHLWLRPAVRNTSSSSVIDRSVLNNTASLSYSRAYCENPPAVCVCRKHAVGWSWR